LHDYSLQDIPGTDNADFLSRYITNGKLDSNPVLETEQYINMLVNHTVPKDLTITEIAEATQSDSSIQKVISNIKAAKWMKERETAPYILFAHNLQPKMTFF